MSNYRPPLFNNGDKASLWKGGKRLASVRITAGSFVEGHDPDGNSYKGWVYQTDRTGNHWVRESALRVRPQAAPQSFSALMKELAS